MNYETVKEQFGSWAPVLRPFIESRAFDDIFAFLSRRSRVDRAVIVPHHTDLFRAFRESPYDKTRVILVGQDPYAFKSEGSYQADGLAFSSRTTGRVLPSLSALYDAMEADLSGGLDLHMDRNPDLTPLAAQGVLLLNANLTCELGHIGAHAPFVDGTRQVWVWKPLMEFLFNALNEAEPMVMAFLGREAQRYSKIPVPFHHRVLEVEHPAAGGHNGRKWRHERLFGRIEEYLRELYPTGEKNPVVFPTSCELF